MSQNLRGNNYNKSLIVTSLFTALTVVAAFIKIPLPHVPVTLQTFVVLLSGSILGAFYGTLSQIIYLAIGLMGIPVFAYGGGFSYIFQPTFGYLLGYPFCALGVGLILKVILPDIQSKRYKKNTIFFRVLFSNLVGVLIIFIFGLGYIYLNLKYGLYLNLEEHSSFSTINWNNIVMTTFLIFVPIDLIKALLAAFITVKIKRLI